MRLLLVQFSLLLLVASAFGAASKIVEGKLEAAPEGGEAWVIRIGSEAVPVAPEKRTRFWLKKAPVDAKAFHVGDIVVARLAPSESPAALRELTDKESWVWLEAIRKGVREGTVKGFDGKHLTMAFTDGSEMPYRATEKTKVVLAGKDATLGDLKPGQKLWLKGRTLPSLDVWLVEASDRTIVAAVKKTATLGKKRGARKSAKSVKLPPSGRLEGEIGLHTQAVGMFDLTVEGGDRMHVSYFAATAFTFRGVTCGANELTPGRHAVVIFKRDQYGRINASKVEIRQGA